VVRAEALSDFVLEACASLQEAHRGYAGKKPGKFGNFGHIGLSPEDGFFGIEAQGDIIHRNIKRILSNISRRWVAGKGMVVGDEIKTIVLGLQLEMLAHCAEEIAYMKSAGRLYARKNSQIDLLTPIDDIGTKILWKFCAK